MYTLIHCICILYTINQIDLYHRWLELIRCDKRSSNETLPEKDGSVFFHHKKLQILAIKMYKLLGGLGTMVFNNVFKVREQNNYNLSYATNFIIPQKNSGNCGAESLA